MRYKIGYDKIKLYEPCEICNRLPANHIPFDMVACYGIDYFLEFMNRYAKSSTKLDVLKAIAINNENVRMLKFSMKHDWKFLQLMSGEK